MSGFPRTWLIIRRPWDPQPPPSSNRTCGFPASGFPESLQAQAGHSRWQRRGETRVVLHRQSSAWPKPQSSSRLGAYFRSGLTQAVLRAVDRDADSAGALRSTGITPLPRYYSPLRLPTEANDGYVFPPTSCHGPTPVGRDSRLGLSGSSIDLSTSAVLNDPGESSRCMCSLLRGGLQASPVHEG